MAEMHSQARHMNSFRIFYDIQSITYKYFTAVKMLIFKMKLFNIFSLFLLKTLIVGTR